ETPSTVTERGMQFKIDNLEDVKTIRYAYGEYETEKDIKHGEMAVSHSAKILRKRGDSCVLQFPKAGLVSIVIIYNDGSRDFYKYEVIKSSPTVTRDGGNDITFGELSNLKVIRYAKGEFENSNQIKNAANSVAVSGKNLNSDTYTVTLDRETYTFCVQYNDESYNYYVTGFCGDNLTWVYDMQSDTLTISGEGEMEDAVPWYEYISEIKTVVVNQGVTKLNSRAFDGGVSITAVDLPNTLKEIGGHAFNNCISLKSFVLPDCVTLLGQQAFEKCTNLESVILGDGIECIREFTFYECESLVDVTFGNNLKTIDYNAFQACYALDDIDLPDSLISVGEDAFNATAYYNNKDNWDDGLLYLDGHLIYAPPFLNKSSVIIKNGTKSISNFVFYEADISVVFIPQSVTYMAPSAFGDVYAPYPFLQVVKGSYAEEYAIEWEIPYGYYNPSDIYG
ncbi:MAG: leucine-rich repeat domain-containing protein, partial [Clostridia bacterium]|nr:leucine-rich repeat domain-containing protein [Clostridia bacterium]